MTTNVEKFMHIAGQPATRGVFDTRQTAFQIGMCCEELSETIQSLFQGDTIGNGIMRELRFFGEQMKAGVYDDCVQRSDKLELLDGFADVRYVAEGGMAAMGADVEGAIEAVEMNNLTKFETCPECGGAGYFREFTCTQCNGNGRIAKRDENGKVIKPAGYKKVSLEQFL